MKKLIIILLIVIVGCSKETSIEPTIDYTNLVEYDVTCIPPGFTLIYQVRQWYPIHDTINATEWGVSHLGYSGELYFLSVIAFDKNALITATIRYEGKVFKTITRQNYYQSAYIEGYLP
jgi:hypothetical protein